MAYSNATLTVPAQNASCQPTPLLNHPTKTPLVYLYFRQDQLKANLGLLEPDDDREMETQTQAHTDIKRAKYAFETYMTTNDDILAVTNVSKDELPMDPRTDRRWGPFNVDECFNLGAVSLADAFENRILDYQKAELFSKRWNSYLPILQAG